MSFLHGTEGWLLSLICWLPVLYYTCTLLLISLLLWVIFNINVDGSSNTLDSTFDRHCTCVEGHSSPSFLIEAQVFSTHAFHGPPVPTYQHQGDSLRMLLSLKSIMLVPLSLPMIGLGIVTHKGSLLGLWFPLIYEAIALLLGVVT